MTLSQALAEAARRHAGRPALLAPALTLSHAQLDSCVVRAAAELMARGIKPAQVVGVSMHTSPLQLLTLLALAHVGACSVHVHPDHPLAVKRALAQQFGISAVVCDPGMKAPLEADPAWLEAKPGATPALPAGGDGPWRIALSSGTTGLQKGVLITHADALAEIARMSAAESVTRDDVLLCHRGLDSNWALRTVLSHLVCGGAVAFPATRSASHLLEAVKRHAATRLMVSPAYLRDLVEQLPGGGLPGVRRILIGGGALPAELLALAAERITPNLATGYGITEIGTLALADRALLARAPASVGGLLPGVEGEAVDADDRRVPRGQRGILRFRRPGMPQEYFRHPEASAKMFRHGWFYPGDVGRIDAEGLLYIEGRVDDELNLGGMKIEPEPIEQALREHAAVVEAAVFAAAPDRGPPALFAAAVLRTAVDEKDLIAHCRSRVGPMYAPVRIFFVEQLPRNDAGKLLRRELAQRVGRRVP